MTETLEPGTQELRAACQLLGAEIEELRTALAAMRSRNVALRRELRTYEREKAASHWPKLPGDEAERRRAIKEIIDAADAEEVSVDGISDALLDLTDRWFAGLEKAASQQEIERLRAIVKRAARMGLCSQTHHEHLMAEARAALETK